MADLLRLEARAPDIQAALTVLGHLRGADLRCAQLKGARHLEHADLRGAVTDTKTRWPAGFNAAAAGVQVGAGYN